MADRVHTEREIQDRFAIMDLYDRQLAAAEAWDFEAYDTTFDASAQIDLRDFGQPVRLYAGYREWLASLRTVMVAAQRITGGLRLTLDGDRADHACPGGVLCDDGVRRRSHAHLHRALLQRRTRPHHGRLADVEPLRRLRLVSST